MLKSVVFSPMRANLLGGLKAFFEVGQNVFDCLETDRQANEAWKYSR
jgi:hypothetical protein